MPILECVLPKGTSMAVLLTESDPSLSLEKMNIDLFRRRLVEVLLESGIDARSPHLTPLFKMIDDDVQWFRAALRARAPADASGVPAAE